VEWLLLRQGLGMNLKIAVGLVLGLGLALVVASYIGPSPSPAPAAASSVRSLAASRLFMLLPDGRVEVTDTWARRVYRWDGERWVELEVTKLPGRAADLH
jgi:hypothetical protein